MDTLNGADSGRSSPSLVPFLTLDSREKRQGGAGSWSSLRLKVHKSARLRQRPKFRENLSPDARGGVGPARPPGSCEVAPMCLTEP